MILHYFLKQISDIMLNNKSYASCPYKLCIFLGSIVSIILGEIYLSCSIYAYLIEETEVKSYQSFLIIAAIFFFQLIVLRISNKLLIKKENKTNIIVQDYNAVKGTLNQFILGFQKR